MAKSHFYEIDLDVMKDTCWHDGCNETAVASSSSYGNLCRKHASIYNYLHYLGDFFYTLKKVLNKKATKEERYE